MLKNDRIKKTLLVTTILLTIIGTAFATGFDTTGDIYNNIATGTLAHASANYTDNFTARMATDGDPKTIWASPADDKAHWIFLDLGKPAEIEGFIINWFDKYYAVDYQVFVSNDKTTWNLLYGKTGYTGGPDLHQQRLTTRYLGIICSKKNDIAYAIKEIQVYQNAKTDITRISKDVNISDTFNSLEIKGNYLFAGTNNHYFVIYDISIPDKPVLINRVRTKRTVDCIKIKGNYAFVNGKYHGVSSVTGELEIYDITDLMHVTKIGELESGSVEKIDIWGNYLIYQYYNRYNPTVKVVDISNINAPVPVTTISQKDSFHIYNTFLFCKNFETIEVYNLEDITNTVPVASYPIRYLCNAQIEGNYLYTVTFDSLSDIMEFTISDITDVTNPQLIATYTEPINTISYTTIKLVAIDNNLAYIRSSINYGRECTLHILDITDMSAITEIKEVPHHRSNCTDVVSKNNTAYLSFTINGIYTLDIANAATADLELYIKNSGQSFKTAYSGHYALVAEGYTGLKIIDIQNTTEPKMITRIFDDPDTNVIDVLVQDNYAYVTVRIEENDYVKIADISDIRNITILGEIMREKIDGMVVYKDDYLVLYCPDKTITIYNVKDPAHITEVSSMTFQSTVSTITIKDNYAFVGLEGFFSTELLILNLANINYPYIISRLGITYTPQDIIVSGNYLIINANFITEHKTGSISHNALDIVNISSIRYPYLVSTINPGLHPTGLTLIGNIAYMPSSFYNYGKLYVYDLNNKANPVLIKTMDFDKADDVTIIDEKMYVTHSAEGLAIYDVK